MASARSAPTTTRTAPASTRARTSGATADEAHAGPPRQLSDRRPPVDLLEDPEAELGEGDRSVVISPVRSKDRLEALDRGHDRRPLAGDPLRRARRPPCDRDRQRCRPGRGHVRTELELGATRPQQRHDHLEQPDLQCLAALHRSGEIADLTGAESAVDEVEGAVDLAPVHDQHAARRGALDQAEDLGEREVLESARQQRIGLQDGPVSVGTVRGAVEGQTPAPEESPRSPRPDVRGGVGPAHRGRTKVRDQSVTRPGRRRLRPPAWRRGGRARRSTARTRGRPDGRASPDRPPSARRRRGHDGSSGVSSGWYTRSTTHWSDARLDRQGGVAPPSRSGVAFTTTSAATGVRPRPVGRGHPPDGGGERRRSPRRRRAATCTRAARSTSAATTARAAPPAPRTTTVRPAGSSPASASERRNPSPSVESPRSRAVGARDDHGVHRRAAPPPPGSARRRRAAASVLVRHRDIEPAQAERRPRRGRRRRPCPGATSQRARTPSRARSPANAALWIAGDREWRTGAADHRGQPRPPGDHLITPRRRASATFAWCSA